MKKQTKIFGITFGGIKARKFRWGDNVIRDWFLVLGGFVVLALCVIVFTYVHFMDVRDPQDGSDAALQAGDILPKGLLTSVVEYYEGRRASEEEILKSNPVADPSR